MKCVGILLDSKVIEEIDLHDYSDVNKYSVLSDSKGNIFWLTPTDFKIHQELMVMICDYIQNSTGLGRLLNIIDEDDDIYVLNALEDITKLHSRYIEFMNNNQVTSLSHELNSAEINFTLDIQHLHNELKDYKFKVRISTARISKINTSNNEYTVDYKLSRAEISNNETSEYVSYPDDTYIIFKICGNKIQCMSDIKRLIYLVKYGD